MKIIARLILFVYAWWTGEDIDPDIEPSGRHRKGAPVRPPAPRRPKPQPMQAPAPTMGYALTIDARGERLRQAGRLEPWHGSTIPPQYPNPYRRNPYGDVLV